MGQARSSEHHPQGVLVTGGAGFIGSHVVRHLVRTLPETRLVNLDLLTYAGDLGRVADVAGHPHLETIVGDIADPELVREILGDERIDSVLHLAAESHVDRSIAGPAEFIRTNIVGTFTLLEACRDLWGHSGGMREGVRFVHVSTDEVYGQLGPQDPPFTEATPYAPNSPYSASKAASDHLARAYGHTFGLPVVTTNCSNNFGPHQHGEKFIPTVIRACIEGRPIPVYGDGQNVRDWLFVEDHCRGLELAMRRGRPGETYVIGGGGERANIEVARMICGIMDELRPSGAPHADLITFVADRPGHDWRYAIDPAKAKGELGWKARETYESGLKLTVQWYVDQAEGTVEGVQPMGVGLP